MKFNTIIKGLLLELSGDEIYKKYYSDLSYLTFKNLVKFDPQTVIRDEKILKLGRFSKLIINLHKGGVLKNEDLPKIKEYLSYVYKYNIPVNINEIKSLPDLFDLIKDYKVNETKELSVILQTLPENEYKVLHNGKEWYVFHPLTERASCQIGVNTEWCTTWGKHSLNASHKDRESHYRRYHEQGPLYIIINKIDLNKKYQFHFESSQYMDRYDRSINIISFLNENPEIKNFFFPSLYDKNVSEDVVDAELNRVDVLSKKDLNIFMRNIVGDKNDLINKILLRDNKDFINKYDDLFEFYVETHSNWIDIEMSNLAGDVVDVENTYESFYTERQFVTEDLMNEIYDDLNHDETWKNICESLFNGYYIKHKNNILNKLRIRDYETFYKEYFEKFVKDDKIKETFANEYVNINESSLEGKIDDIINGITNYFKFLRSYGTRKNFKINLPRFVLFLKREDISSLEDFRYFEDLLDKYIYFYGIPTYYEPVDRNTEYPDSSNKNILEQIENFFLEYEDDIDDECKNKDKQLRDIIQKFFNGDKKFENERVFLEINDTVVNCEKGTVNVTFKDKTSGKTYNGDVKINNLPNYIYNYQLFENIITFKKNI